MWLAITLGGLATLRLILLFILHAQIKKSSQDFIDNTAGVSIIIAAKNEKENLQKLIPFILDQAYPSFEVIIVDDFSTDGSDKLDFGDLRCKIICATHDILGKKAALAQGIDEAKYDLLLFTDADCVPKTKNWISKMVGKMDSNKDIVLGFSPMEHQTHFVAWLSRYETIHTALLYLGLAKFGMPYMGVGRNLLYRKSKFLKSGGFNTHHNIPAGDDDLQIQRMSSQHNVDIQIHPDAWVYTQPKPNFTSYFRQKSRHLGVSQHYKLPIKLGLGFVTLLQWCFYGFLLYSLAKFGPISLWGIFTAMALFFIMAKVSSDLGDKLVGRRSLYLDFIFILLQPLTFLSGLIDNKSW
jgi:glycosyltransferase involved in cell wall biosynthesis